jgi:hypothetical protein
MELLTLIILFSARVLGAFCANAPFLMEGLLNLLKAWLDLT